LFALYLPTVQQPCIQQDPVSGTYSLPFRRIINKWWCRSSYTFILILSLGRTDLFIDAARKIGVNGYWLKPEASQALLRAPDAAWMNHVGLARRLGLHKEGRDSFS
jgi:hypothetical protein